MASIESRFGVADVDRSALVQRVVSSNARIVTLVAPAGYGKSRFARSLLALTPLAGVADCLQMHDVAEGVRVLLRALEPFEQRFERRLARQLVSLPRDGSADGHWTELLDEGIARSDGAAMLCIENAECLAGGPEVSTLVERVVHDSRRRVVLCSRIPLDLSSLSRVPPNERYAIDIDDLRFSDDESRGLFDAFGLDGALLDRAIELARGWPIAVLMFARAAQEDRLCALIADVDSGSGVRDLDDYVVTQVLGALGEETRTVLAGAALLGRVTDDDVRRMTDRWEQVNAELARCPLVSSVADELVIHPLAGAVSGRMRDAAVDVVRRAAEATPDPIRAAQLFLGAGEQDRAADILDTAVAPLMVVQELTPTVASLVAALDESVLTRHHAMWSATIQHRIMTISGNRMLAECRAAWASLKNDDPLRLRVSVGLNLANVLALVNRTLEAARIFESLQRELAAQPEDVPERILVDLWQGYVALRAGKAIAWDELSQRARPLADAIPTTAALMYVSFSAPIAFFNGDCDKARRDYAVGLELEAESGAEPIYAAGIISAAFFAWLTGDRALFAARVEELRRALSPSVVESTRHFLGCAIGDRPASTPTGYEIHVIRAHGWMIAAAREQEFEVRRSALRAALDAAAEDGEPWLLAVTWLAVGLADPSQRSEAFAQAKRYAASVEYEAFRIAVDDATAGAIPEMIAGLRQFVNETPPEPFFIGLSGELHVGARTISLSRREAELLLALALHAASRDRRTLAALLWPDDDEMERANTVNVYMGRLRRRLGDLDLVESSVSGYALRHPVAVDLILLEEAIAQSRATQPLDLLLEQLVMRPARLPQWVATSEWLRPFVRRYEDAIRFVRIERARAAEASGDLAVARRHYGLAVADDPEDAAAAGGLARLAYC